MNLLIQGLLVGLLLMPAALPPAHAAEARNYKEVAPTALRGAPQQHWAKGIVFKDVPVERPDERPLKFERKRYPPLRLRTLGLCYLNPDLAERIEDWPFDRTCFFHGTVLQADRDFFVIVDGFVPAEGIRSVEEDLELILDPDAARMQGSPEMRMQRLLQGVQARIVAYCQTFEVEPAELFDTNSAHYGKAEELVRGALIEQEREMRTTIPEILTEYFANLFEARYAAEPEPGQPAESETGIEEAPGEPSTEEPAEAEASSDRSWWGRLWGD